MEESLQNPATKRTSENGAGVGKRETEWEKDWGERSCVGQEDINRWVRYLAELSRAENRLRAKQWSQLSAMLWQKQRQPQQWQAQDMLWLQGQHCRGTPTPLPEMGYITNVHSFVLDGHPIKVKNKEWYIWFSIGFLPPDKASAKAPLTGGFGVRWGLQAITTKTDRSTIISLTNTELFFAIH